MTPIADIDRIARCIGNRTHYPWRFSKLFVPQLRASRRCKRKRGRDNYRHNFRGQMSDVRCPTERRPPLARRSPAAAGGRRRAAPPVRSLMSDVRCPKPAARFSGNVRAFTCLCLSVPANKFSNPIPLSFGRRSARDPFSSRWHLGHVWAACIQPIKCIFLPLFYTFSPENRPFERGYSLPFGTLD
jgi:hypothetical protein